MYRSFLSDPAPSVDPHHPDSLKCYDLFGTSLRTLGYQGGMDQQRVAGSIRQALALMRGRALLNALGLEHSRLDAERVEDSIRS